MAEHGLFTVALNGHFASGRPVVVLVDDTDGTRAMHAGSSEIIASTDFSLNCRQYARPTSWHAALFASFLHASLRQGFPVVPRNGHPPTAGPAVVVTTGPFVVVKTGPFVDVVVVWGMCVVVLVDDTDGTRAMHAGSSEIIASTDLSLNCRQYARPTSWHATLFASLLHASLRQGFPVVPRNGHPPTAGPAVVVTTGPFVVVVVKTGPFVVVDVDAVVDGGPWTIPRHPVSVNSAGALPASDAQ
jgi:hypothetical protein